MWFVCFVFIVLCTFLNLISVSSYFLFLHIFWFCAAEAFSLLLAAGQDWLNKQQLLLSSTLFTKKITSLDNKVSTLTANIFAFPQKAGQKISSTVYAIEVWKSLCGQFSQTRCDRKLGARSKNYHFMARNNCSFFSALFTVWTQNQNLHHKVRVCIFWEERSTVATKFCLLVIYSRSRGNQQKM